MQAVEAATEIITVDQGGQHISVSDELIQKLGDLYGRRIVVTDECHHGYDIQKTHVSLLKAEDNRRLSNAGLFSALQYRASQRGIRLNLRISPAIASLPEPVRLNSLQFPQLADFVHKVPLGCIAVPGKFKPEQVIYELAQAYPESKIVVLGNHCRQLDRIFDFLKTQRISTASISSRAPLIVADDVEDDEMPQVVLSTYLEAGSINCAIKDIVIVLDAESCIQDRTQLCLSMVDARFRLYGLIKKDRVPAPAVADMIFSVFGPELLKLCGSGRSRRKAHFTSLVTPLPIVKLSRLDIDFAKKCYWHHERRNRLIRQLACALTSGEPLDQCKFADVAAFIHQLGDRRPARSHSKIGGSPDRCP